MTRKVQPAVDMLVKRINKVILKEEKIIKLDIKLLHQVQELITNYKTKG